MFYASIVVAIETTKYFRKFIFVLELQNFEKKIILLGLKKPWWFMKANTIYGVKYETERPLFKKTFTTVKSIDQSATPNKESPFPQKYIDFEPQNE